MLPQERFEEIIRIVKREGAGAGKGSGNLGSYYSL